MVAADANDWDSVCTLAQLILQVRDYSAIIHFAYVTSVNAFQGRDGLARAADRARVLLSFIASCGHPRLFCTRTLYFNRACARIEYNVVMFVGLVRCSAAWNVSTAPWTKVSACWSKRHRRLNVLPLFHEYVNNAIGCV